MPDKELTCPCGEYDYVVCYERRGKKEDPSFCPFCGADGAAEGLELEEDEDDDIKILKKKPVEPTLDDILEKIHIYGYNSLSENEKKLLNKYSN